MKKREYNKIVMMDFSGIYRNEQFCENFDKMEQLYEDVCRQDQSYKNQKISWVEARDLTGTNCYCDDEAKKQIQNRIREYSAEGIHFIDSGNYHYMSRIWLEKIEEPFRLLVFDNHTDMQLPAFGGILSCGGWIAASLEELPNLKEVILVGPDEEAFSQVEPWMQEKVRFFSREKLAAATEKERLDFFESIECDLSLYISVDKDVLCPDDAATTWSQGDMRLAELEAYLNVLLKHTGDKLDIIGMDVCGECDADAMEDSGLNDRANERLLELWLEQGE